MDMLYSEGINPIIIPDNFQIHGAQPIGYRGRESFDAGIVYTPHIPLQVMETNIPELNFTIERVQVEARTRRLNARWQLEELVDGVWTRRQKKPEKKMSEHDAYWFRLGI